MLNLFYPPAVMAILGLMSDVCSDLAPVAFRPMLHVIFTWLLN